MKRFRCRPEGFLGEKKNHSVRKPGESKAFFFNSSAPPACNWVTEVVCRCFFQHEIQIFTYEKKE